MSEDAGTKECERRFKKWFAEKYAGVPAARVNLIKGPVKIAWFAAWKASRE